MALNEDLMKILLRSMSRARTMCSLFTIKANVSAHNNDKINVTTAESGAEDFIGDLVIWYMKCTLEHDT